MCFCVRKFNILCCGIINLHSFICLHRCSCGPRIAIWHTTQLVSLVSTSDSLIQKPRFPQCKPTAEIRHVCPSSRTGNKHEIQHTGFHEWQPTTWMYQYFRISQQSDFKRCIIRKCEVYHGIKMSRSTHHILFHRSNDYFCAPTPLLKISPPLTVSQ